jgi:NADPH-dependent glutamate synthase beta subunit-like oxidoreductase/CO/xanthine dehydrogenase FAD-binding subunit
MATFKHINTTTPEEAKSILSQYKGKAKVIAGGTDLFGQIKDKIRTECPEVLVNIKTIDGLDYIKEQKGILKIGALTRVEDIAKNKKVREGYPVLAEAAQNVASPHIREMGTLGGNICQSVRCWYYWVESNRFDCIRKGGKICNAFLGDNRYHSIFGSVRIDNTPCTSACPGNVKIPDYFSKLREGKLDEAAGILMERNPIPAITGRVCPHPCEADCNRGSYDEPVSVNAVERYVGSHILDNTAKFYKSLSPDTGKKIAVIGSGPAGLSAAYYLRKAGNKVTIFDRAEEAGGMLRYGIPAYRLPKDIVRKQVQALKDMGIEFKLKTEIGKGTTLSKLKSKYDIVFMATGAWSQPKLNIEGYEKAEFGIDFLERVNAGKKVKPGKKVVVIGGGNVAVDVAVSALRLGSEDVTMVCLEKREEMPAIPADVEDAIKEGVKVMPSWGPSKVVVKNGKITGLEMIQCTSVFDKNGRFAPRYDECTLKKLSADNIIMAIGQRPELDYIDLPLKIERGWTIVKEDTQATSDKNIYAGGDMTGGVPTVIRSIATGRKAAEAINKYLKVARPASIDSRELGRTPQTFNVDYFSKTSRAEISELSVKKRKIDIEDRTGISLKEVKAEATRCFNCGCVAVNNSDIAPALIALNAKVKTTSRTIAAEDFFSAGKDCTTICGDDEIVTEVQVPQPARGTSTKFMKFALRKSIDYPIINCAAAIENEKGKVKSARICLNAVYNIPLRLKPVEKLITGKRIDEQLAEKAGEEAVKNNYALSANKYKVNIARALVKRTILACKDGI